MKFVNFEIFLFKNSKINKKKPTPTVLIQNIFFLKIITDQGIVGYGELNPYIINQKKIIFIINNLLNNFIIGKKLNETNLLLKKIKIKYKNNSFLKFIVPILEQCFYDIISKSLSLPLYKYLAQKYNCKSKLNINLYASGGMLFENQNFDLLIDEAINAQEKGYIGWKFRPKTPTLNPDHFQRSLNPPDFNHHELILFLKKLKKIIHPDFKIMIDFGKRVKKNKESIYLLENLNDLDLYFVEEPFKPVLYKYNKLQIKYQNIKLATGENFSNYEKLKKWIDKNFVSYLQPDANSIPISDIHNALYYSKHNKINFILHNWSYPINTLFNFHIGCSTNKIDLVEYSIIGEEIKNMVIKESLPITNGQYKMSSKPGIGFDLDEKILKKLKI